MMMMMGDQYSTAMNSVRFLNQTAIILLTHSTVAQMAVSELHCHKLQHRRRWSSLAKENERVH